MYKKYIKRLLDIILSLIGIIITFPFLIIIYILVLIFLGYPAIFKQERPGKNAKIFTLYKFRTMTNKKDKQGNLLPDEKRLTKFGKFLRKTSLDELPEFFNILKGDMSFIGPRPLLVEYLDYYTEEESHRHDVRPGLTGLAQVNGRNLLSWEGRFKKDLEYVNNITFINDIKIILKTIKTVLIREGINQEGSATMKPFYRKKEKMAKEVIIIGSGGHAKVIADIIEKSGDRVVGFLDDNINLNGEAIYKDKKVLGTTNDIEKYQEYYFIIGIGNNQVRKNISNKYNLKWYKAIHPTAIIANCVRIGEGTAIMAGAIINPNTVIGNHCIINTKASVDHDNLLEDYIHISPGATLAGTVKIKELTWICAGATVINNIKIEKNSIIGAGAVVIKNITIPNKTYIGIPAKELVK